jgi:hypothetical protein
MCIETTYIVNHTSRAIKPKEPLILKPILAAKRSSSFTRTAENQKKERLVQRKTERLQDLTLSSKEEDNNIFFPFIIDDKESSSTDIVIYDPSLISRMSFIHCDVCFTRKTETTEFYLLSCKHIECQECYGKAQGKGWTCLKCQKKLPIISFKDNKNRPATSLYTASDLTQQVMNNSQAMVHALQFRESKTAEYVKFITGKLDQYRASTEAWRDKYEQHMKICGSYQPKPVLDSSVQKTLNEYKRHIDQLRQENAMLKKKLSSYHHDSNQRKSLTQCPSMMNGGEAFLRANGGTSHSQAQIPISHTPHRSHPTGYPNQGQRIGLSNVSNTAQVHKQQSTTRLSMAKSQEMMDVDETPKRTLMVAAFPQKRQTPQTSSTQRLTLAGLTTTPYTRHSGQTRDPPNTANTKISGNSNIANLYPIRRL